MVKKNLFHILVAKSMVLMNMKKHIPNIITLGNLLCGTLAVIYAVKGDFYMTTILVAAGITFDFFDGFVARLLEVQGEFGKQLDSLADMVTSGVVPGIVMVQYMLQSTQINAVSASLPNAEMTEQLFNRTWFTYEHLGFVLTLFAGYRLAKFNIDTRQSDNFIGLPTPAMNIFVLSLPLIAEQTSNTLIQDIIRNPYVLVLITFALSILMVSEIELFALKFKDYSFKQNKMKYSFLLLSVVCLGIFKFLAIPLIIILYVTLSLSRNYRKKMIS